MRISRRRKHHVKPSKTYFRYNDRIRVSEIRVIDDEDNHLDVMQTSEAMKLAKERGLDLVEINPAAKPPICKIMEYGQFKYQQEKAEKIRKAKQKETGVKGVRLSARIGKHDRDIRKKQALKFLKDGHNVRVEIILRGREKGHADIVYGLIREFITELDNEFGIRVEQIAKRMGSKIATIVAPTEEAKAAPVQTETTGESKEEEETKE